MKLDSSRVETIGKPRDLLVDDLPELLARQPVEDNNLVEAVEELGPKMPSQQAQNLLLHLGVGSLVPAIAVAEDLRTSDV